MSSIQRLIADLAPDGVPTRALGDVARISARNMQPAAMGDGMVSVYSLPSFDRGREPETLTGSEVGSAKTKLTGPAVLVGKLNPHIPRVWKLDSVSKDAYCSPEFYPIEPNPEMLDIGFLYHFLLSKMSWLAGAVTGSTNSHKRLHKSDFLSLLMPVPPLEVQREVVGVLDKLTELEENLKAELEARRRQFDYYAGVLLVHDDTIPRVNLGKVATIVRGASPRPIQKFITSSSDGLPWIKIGDVPPRGKYITETSQRVTADGAAKSRRVMPGDFVLSNSMSFGRPYISKIDGYIHDGWLAISAFQDSFVPDYLYYLLRSEPIQQEFARRAGSGTVKNLNAEIVRSIEVPIPPKQAQEQVVELLDRFNELVNHPRAGIPAEIAARRKQYEHYRDRLLTFEETIA